jgi:hypothetical protein
VDIILYAMTESITAQNLEEMLKKITPIVLIRRFYTLQQFMPYIIEHRTDQHIVILVIERSKEFIALHSLFKNNESTNLIIVCDDKEETIAFAHELRPRFLAHGNEIERVKAVVEKMMQLTQNI